jgi:hypothetical protein
MRSYDEDNVTVTIQLLLLLFLRNARHSSTIAQQ